MAGGGIAVGGWGVGASVLVDRSDVELSKGGLVSSSVYADDAIPRDTVLPSPSDPSPGPGCGDIYPLSLAFR